MFLSDLSLKRPVFATVVILALVALGLFSYTTLSVDEFPPVEFPYVAVSVVEQGASPDQVEKKVVKPIEDAFSEIKGIKHIYARSSESYGLVFGEFTLETDPAEAAQNVRDKMSSVRGNLPDDIEEPLVMKFDPSAQPIISVALSGNKSRRELSYYVDNIIKKRLESVNGVGSLDIYGSQDREIQINLDIEKMNAYGLTTAEVVSSLSSENMAIPAGKIEDKGRAIIIKTEGEMDSIDQFYDLSVGKRNGINIFVKDVAMVKDGIQDASSIARYQNKNAIGIDITKQSGANTVDLSKKINKVLDDIKGELPPGVQLNVVKDNSVYIEESLNNVMETLVEGSLLAVFIVFIFLHNIRTTLICAVAIPTSILTTFFMMKVLGFTLNNMTLMALSLCVGLLIDDAIVVIENIERHRKMGKTALQATKDATNEIGLAVMATTLAIIAVFAPIGMLTGIVGQFFKQFGFTAVCAVAMSFIVSFTLVPLLASHNIGSESDIKVRFIGRWLQKFNDVFDSIASKYADLLRMVLRHRVRVVILAVIIFFCSLGIAPLLGMEFMTAEDRGQINVSLEYDNGETLSASSEKTKEIEKVMRQYTDVKEIYSTIESDTADLLLKLNKKGERDKSLEEIGQGMRRDLQKIPGIRASVQTSEGMGSSKPFEVYLLGEDIEVLQKYADQVTRIVESIPGAIDVSSSYKPGSPEEKIIVRNSEAADLGISTAQIGTTLNTLYTGTVVGQYQEGDNRDDVRVRIDPSQRKSIDILNRVYLATGGDEDPYVSLNQLVERKYSPSASKLSKFDRQKQITISANLEGTTIGEFNKTFFKQVEEKVQFPEGYSIYAGGDTEMLSDLMVSLMMALVLGVLFIFFVLAAQFESYIDPISIMLSLPMAIIGALGGLLIMGSSLTMMSMIGIIMLMGLVTKNAILLIDFTKQRRACGEERTEALVHAGSVRLRPIIMTTMAMIFGMMPLAMALGEGAEGRAPMAYTIIGGLITSTILTLIVVPVFYTLLDDLKQWIRRKIPHLLATDAEEVCKSENSI